MNSTSHFSDEATAYIELLHKSITRDQLYQVETLAKSLRSAWIEGRNVYLCGNGGSAANAMHLANDFHYGVGACGPGPQVVGLKVEALPSNPGVITCLANDSGYDTVFSHQLEVKSRPGDILIALTGSGRSQNIVRALQTAQIIGVQSFAIVAFDGGLCKNLADISIHVPTFDMQIAEDVQLVIGHICMQWLNRNKPVGLRTLSVS